MASLNTQTRFVNIVIRKNNINISERDNLIRNWCNDNCELYAYIYHKHDINPTSGEMESEHLHLVATLRSVRRLSTTLTSICSYLGLNSSNGVEIDKINSYEGSMQYLIHRNDKQKTQHVIDEITHNYDLEELKTIMSCTSDNLTAERLFDIVLNARSNYDIIKAVGLNRYHNLRGVIKDIKEDVLLKRRLKIKDLEAI